MKKYLIPHLLLLAVCAMPAVAGERTDLVFTNRLNEEIVDIRVQYATPDGEPRHHSSHVNLPAGEGGWRLGVQGTTLPERIIFDLATKSYDFDDLSELDPASEMSLTVEHRDGSPILWRTDGDEDERGPVQGEERDYLTTANRTNAVDRNDLTSLTRGEEVGELVVKTLSDARERLGEVETFDIEAGPIWSHDNALTRCPEAVAEWSEENGREARWNGQWKTTVPGEMSVCGCTTGTAELEETVFTEDDGWGETAYFPVQWEDWTGLAKVQPMDKDNEDEGIGFDLRFRLPGNDIEKMLEDLLDDLLVDGFRPWRFAMRTGDGEDDTVDFVFHEDDGDKYHHQVELQEALFGAYENGTLVEASATYVKEDAFAALKSGEEPEPAQGVMVMFSKETFEALFVPNGRTLME
jgi:hypothetical protein